MDVNESKRGFPSARFTIEEEDNSIETKKKKRKFLGLF
jgi:hypothetical protein